MEDQGSSLREQNEGNCQTSAFMSTHYPKQAAAEVFHGGFHNQEKSTTTMALQTTLRRDMPKPPSELCADVKELKQSMSFKSLPEGTASLKQYAATMGWDEAEQEQMEYKNCRHSARFEAVQAVEVSSGDRVSILADARQRSRNLDMNFVEKEIEAEQNLEQEMTVTRLKRTDKLKRLTKSKNTQDQNDEKLHMDWCKWMYAEAPGNADGKQINSSGGERRKANNDGLDSLIVKGGLLGGSST